MRTLVSLILLLSMAVGAWSTPERPRAPRVVYVESTENIANPERGPYHSTETFASNHTPLERATLLGYRQSEQVTLVLREVVLDSFRRSPISAAYLEAIAADCAVARSAGVKLIMRFVYNQTGVAPNPDEASLSQILAHLDQLRPLLAANSDVIAVVQAGLIGAWGEWYYTSDEFGAPPNPPNYAARASVVERLLATVPATRMIQVRTPSIKQHLFGTPSGAAGALPASMAFDGSSRARVGHHNDCFVASADDFGTYEDPSQEYPYLAAETQYLPMGGETCALSPPRSSWPSAQAEMQLFHWSYLNLDYHQDVLNSWGANLATARLKLGYRFVLQTSTLDATARPGGSLHVQLSLKNVGWASPFNPRPLQLILRSPTTGAVVALPLAADPRRWLPSDQPITVDERVVVPASLPLGDYDLLLALPDPVPALAADPAYAIQLANQNVWEPATGYNRLQATVKVVASTGVYLPFFSR